jgi:hypothetical protein
MSYHPLPKNKSKISRANPSKINALLCLDTGIVAVEAGTIPDEESFEMPKKPIFV